MHLGTFRERVKETAEPATVETVPDANEEDFQHSIDFSPAEFEAEATEFASRDVQPMTPGESCN